MTIRVIDAKTGFEVFSELTPKEKDRLVSDLGNRLEVREPLTHTVYRLDRETPVHYVTELVKQTTCLDTMTRFTVYTVSKVDDTTRI